MLKHVPVLCAEEPAWETVDTSLLPHMAFASGHPDRQETWRIPHHFVQDGKVESSGRYEFQGKMYVHRGGLLAALAETSLTAAERQHLQVHARALEIHAGSTPAVIHGALLRNEPGDKRTKSSVQLKAYSLQAVSGKIQAATTLEGLKALEDACLLHFAEVEKGAENWLLKERAASESRQVTRLVAFRRRQILAQPTVLKEKTLYDLGKLVGSSK